MTQKRVLVIGAILLAAGIGAPTTAFLAPGGVLSDPRTPEVQAPVPGAAEDDSKPPAGTSPASPGTAAVPPSAGAATTTSPPDPGRPAAQPSRTRVVRPGGGPSVRPEPPREPKPSSTVDDRNDPPRVIDSPPAEIVFPGPTPDDDWDSYDR